MSDNKPVLTPEQIEAISGGCDAETIRQVINDMKQNYDNLVDFTSYVIERIAGGPTSGP